MIVNVDHVVFGVVHVVYRGMQHGNRLKVLQQKGLLVFRIGGRLVANLLLRLILMWRALRCQPRREA